MLTPCPKCRNNLQNAIPSGSPDKRRCASCKHVFDVYMIFYYSKEQGLFNVSYENVKHYHFPVDVIKMNIGEWWMSGDTIIMKVKYDYNKS